MKNSFILLVLLLFAKSAAATTLFEQLCLFNFNWEKYGHRAPAGPAQHFSSDKEYIQIHLSSVLEILRSNPVDLLTEEQYQSRIHLIEVLDEYRIAGRFPINYYRQERIPVFIDEHDTHCAVGYLLKETGNETLALRIAAADNYVWVKDIHDADLVTWQKSSGFTMEELKLIQGAYDFYRADALYAPNKYEIPQKPMFTTRYFEDESTGIEMEKTTKNIWCHGEGANGVLDGRWEQNYAPGLPWIVGYYEKGKRSGQWEEYYEGTKQLCRTECWRNDKLNGIRKRFDRDGNLIEEILFKNGNAVTKTNFDLNDSLTWVRKPLDSNRVYTEVYTLGGSLIASGKESIYNPGNLLWFQNIELTALNSASITARDITVSSPIYRGRRSGGPVQYAGGLKLYSSFSTSPSLVEYKKEGEWTYYKEYAKDHTAAKSYKTLQYILKNNYRHFGEELFIAINNFQYTKLTTGYDSLRVTYSGNLLKEFCGYGEVDYTHLQISYYEVKADTKKEVAFYDPAYRIYPINPQPLIKTIGQYNKAHQKTGDWKYFDKKGTLYRIDSFIVPRDEEEELTEM